MEQQTFPKMLQQTLPKMSLEAQWDDLCRYSKVLTSGSEVEFKTFSVNQLNLLRKKKYSELEIRNLQEQISRLQSENGRLETKIKHIKGLLSDAVSARNKVEAEKDSLARQIEIIKEVLLSDAKMDNQTKQKIASLSSTCKFSSNSPNRLETIEESAGSLFNLSDIDQTDDDLDQRRSRGKRRSSESRISLKKKKLDETEQFISNKNDCGNVPLFNTGYRSSSEPTSSSPESQVVLRQTHKSDSAHTYELRRSNTGTLTASTPVGQRDSGKKGKNHVFVTKTLMNRVKCNPCGRYIGFVKQVLKCQNCRVICHIECRDKCPTPCFPIVNTPTKGNPGTIADYTSSTSPMIPPLIVHCVNEIESRGLREIGLYRISGSERDVKNLKEKFVTGRTIPCLNEVGDIHVLCGTVKEFLRSLKEPLITSSAWQAFVDAATVENNAVSLNSLYEIVMDLPQPNRDTLAFLMLHLQKISESPDCKMSIDNLAKVFGPTIIGYSESDLNQMNMLLETSQQHQVVQRLLSIPSDSWENLLNFEQDVFKGILKKTPEKLPAPKGTRLGPIYSSVQKTRSLSAGRNPRTPRNSKYNKSEKTQFLSPFLK